MKPNVLMERRAWSWTALARLLWCLVALTILGLVITSLVAAASSLRPGLPVAPLCDHCSHALVPVKEMVSSKPWFASYVLSISVLCVVFALCHFIVAGVLAWRKSDDRTALLAAFALVLLAITFCNDLPTLPSFWRTLNAHVMFLGLTLLFVFFCLFPMGRLTPWWSRCLALAAVCYWGSFAVFTRIPFLPSGRSSLFSTLVEYTLLAGLASLQVYRYQRVSDPILRRQTKWVVFGMCSAVIIYLVQHLFVVVLAPSISSLFLRTLIPEMLFFCSLLLIPLSIGIAILRARLWNIDLLIHRTLVYGTLSACVVGLYILVVGGLGSALQGQGNGLISLLFTGLIAVLFHPLRERLQRAVNYLVYGKRNDPYQVLSQLSRRLETALVLDETLSTIVETIAQAFKLPYAAIMLKQGEREEPGAVYGQVRPEDRLLRLALTYQGEMLGELVLSTGPSGETYSARDQRLLEDLVRHAGTAVHAVHLHAAMRRSRELLVTAREEERRRLRRDLHDGLGPQLASLMLILTAGRKMVRSNAEAAEHMLTEAMTHLQEAINDIRRLVYGLRPPALDDLGLLATLQEDLRHYQMSGLACVLVAPDSLPSLPAAVEVACYRIVREALTNVLKHAQARRCIVQIKPGETLDLEVTDDGRGLPPGWKPGIGLSSLHERAQELGGTWNIEARPGGGTCVSAHLPWKYQATATNQQREKKPYGAYALNHR